MDVILVLDSGYQPLRPVPWETGITMVLLNKAEILVEYAGRAIRSASKAFPFPAVIRLLKGFKRRERDFVKFTPENVFHRDGYKCGYCGEEKAYNELTRDHIFPKSRGGKTNWKNIITACRKCNSLKDDKTPEEAGMPLLFKPYKPRWLPPGKNKARIASLPEEWEGWI